MAKLFRSNRSQAVRIPKEYEFPAGVTDVDFVREGNALKLVPKVTTWKEFFERGPRLSEDFPDRIEDLPPQERDFSSWD